MNQANGLLGYSGWDPTHNQEWYGTQRISAYGEQLRATPPMMTVDAYPTFPYMGNPNYESWQFYASPITEAILAETQGYGGIAPLGLQPLANAPQPYEGLM